MASHPTDYAVGKRTSQQLAVDVDRLRHLVRAEHVLEFDPIMVIEFFKANEIPRKGRLKVSLFNASGVPPARVKFKPELRLFIDEEILSAAKEYGDPRARFIIAHEIGHIVEHDHTAKAFSETDAKRRTAWPKEELAEWQADTLADHLLVPWKFVLAYRFDIGAIAAACNVERKVVQRQVDALKSERRYVCKECPECGCFALAPQGTSIKCEVCGTVLDRT